MKSNFEIRVFRDELTQYIPMHCTLQQAKKAIVPMAYAMVEQDVKALELWLVTHTLEKRMCFIDVRGA